MEVLSISKVPLTSFIQPPTPNMLSRGPTQPKPSARHEARTPVTNGAKATPGTGTDTRMNDTTNETTGKAQSEEPLAHQAPLPKWHRMPKSHGEHNKYQITFTRWLQQHNTQKTIASMLDEEDLLSEIYTIQMSISYSQICQNVFKKL